MQEKNIIIVFTWVFSTFLKIAPFVMNSAGLPTALEHRREIFPGVG